MGGELGHRQGRSTPFSSARPGIERTVLTIFLAVRVVHVAQAVTCIGLARAAYRKPRLAVASLLAAVAELVWLAGRDLRRGDHDTTAAALDAAFCVAGLAALGSATAESDRTTSLNWMLPLSVGSCLGAAQALEWPQETVVVGGLAATYAGVARGSIRRGGGDGATAVANALSYPAFALVADLIHRFARRMAAEVDEARQKAVERGAEVAAEQARNREHRLLHDSALQTLEAVASGYDLDPEDLRLQARREAAVLRRSISGERVRSVGLLGRLEELGAEFSDRGLRVELTTVGARVEPSPTQGAALAEAVREALGNVVKHAGVATVVVHVATDAQECKVTVRDQGRGFDRQKSTEGYGIPHSIVARMEEVGGRAQLWSEPGRGTRVELWSPT